MAKKTIDTEQIYWEYIARQNRILGMYCALNAWMTNIDVVCLTRDELAPFWNGLDHFRNDRLAAFESGISDYFEYANRVTFKTGKFSSVFLSRTVLNNQCRTEIITTKRTGKVQVTTLNTKYNFLQLPSCEDMYLKLSPAIVGVKVFQPKYKKLTDLEKLKRQLKRDGG